MIEILLHTPAPIVMICPTAAMCRPAAVLAVEKDSSCYCQINLNMIAKEVYFRFCHVQEAPVLSTAGGDHGPPGPVVRNQGIMLKSVHSPEEDRSSKVSDLEANHVVVTSMRKDSAYHLTV